MNATALGNVESVLRDFVGRNIMFTAFDVTSAVRANSISVRHDDVRNEVQSLFSNSSNNSSLFSGYTRTNVDVGGGMAPFVYHPTGSDASTYDKDWLRTNPLMVGQASQSSQTLFSPTVPVTGNQQPQVPASISSGQTTTVSRSSGRRTHGNTAYPTNDFRLQIPMGIVQQIATSGTILAVHKSTNSSGQNRVSITYPNGSGTAYSVNSDGRIRLPGEYLLYLTQNGSSIGNGTSQYAISVDATEKVINIDPA